MAPVGKSQYRPSPEQGQHRKADGREPQGLDRGRPQGASGLENKQDRIEHMQPHQGPSPLLPGWITGVRETTALSTQSSASRCLTTPPGHCRSPPRNRCSSSEHLQHPQLTG